MLLSNQSILVLTPFSKIPKDILGPLFSIFSKSALILGAKKKKNTETSNNIIILMCDVELHEFFFLVPSLFYVVLLNQIITKSQLS